MLNKIPYKYEEGGFIDDNTEMLFSQINELRHHVSEIEKIVNKNTEVEAWVLAKAERAANDLADITHYLDGRKNVMPEKVEVIEAEEVEDSFDNPYYGEGGRIDEMVEHWDRHGWAGSILGYDDSEFFEKIGKMPMEVATTSFTGDDIKYYNDSILEVVTGGFRRKYADGGMFDSEEEKELKKIVKEDYTDFVKLLGENIKDPKFRDTIKELGKEKSVKYKVINVSCEKLKPTQSEISLDKSLAFPLTSTYYAEMYLKAESPIRIKNNTILTCDNGNYIIDGHHRWSQVFVLNPKAVMACTDFYQLKNPIAGLKATQLGISADLGYLPTQNVQDINMLTVSEETLKNYVSEKITDEVREVFSKYGIDNPEEHIWKNVLLIKTKNKPIKGAPSRDFMPQTDLAENFAEYTPNLSKLAEGGDIEDWGKISDEDVYFGGNTRFKNKWKVKFKYDVENEEYRTVTVDASNEEEARGIAEKKFGKVYDDFEITDARQCYECGGYMADGGMMAKGGGVSRSQKQYNKEVDKYKWFVVDLKEEKATSGWEFKSDAMDALKDYDGDKNFKVVAESKLSSMGIENPKERFKKMAKGGATFNDKVKAISKRLSGTKVPSRLKKDYGAKYDKKEAIEAAKRIAGAMRKKEKLN